MLRSTGDVARILGQDVSRETLNRLEIYNSLLHKWNPAINLVSPRSLTNSWQRHIVDSVQVFAATSVRYGKWLDFGSGGGFPGVVCAILGAELGPSLSFHFVESDRRKGTFLSTVLRETGVNAQVSTVRIEELDPQDAQVISARAVASLTDLLAYAKPHLASEGECVFPKGARAKEEILAAQHHWHFKLTEKPSITDSEAVILVLGEIARV